MILDTNLKNMASSQYLNFNFKSMVNFQGSVLCGGQQGLAVLSGDEDDGVPIISFFEPIETDLGLLRQKRIRAVYVSYISYGEISLTVLSSDNALDSSEDPERKLQIFTLPNTNGELLEYKVFPSRNLMGRYFIFHIGNELSGKDFSVETIYVLPIILSYRNIL